MRGPAHGPLEELVRGRTAAAAAVHGRAQRPSCRCTQSSTSAALRRRYPGSCCAGRARRGSTRCPPTTIAYTAVSRRPHGYYGRDVLLLPERGGVRGGVDIVMLSAPTANPQVTSPLLKSAPRACSNGPWRRSRSARTRPGVTAGVALAAASPGAFGRGRRRRGAPSIRRRRRLGGAVGPRCRFGGRGRFRRRWCSPAAAVSGAALFGRRSAGRAPGGFVAGVRDGRLGLSSVASRRQRGRSRS